MIRRDVAAALAGALGEGVTVVASSQYTDLTPPAVTVDHGDPAALLDDATADVWTGFLEVACHGPVTGDAATSADRLDALVDQVLDALRVFPDVVAVDISGSSVPDTDHPSLTQTLTLRHRFRVCPPEIEPLLEPTPLEE